MKPTRASPNIDRNPKRELRMSINEQDGGRDEFEPGDGGSSPIGSKNKNTSCVNMINKYREKLMNSCNSFDLNTKSLPKKNLKNSKFINSINSKDITFGESLNKKITEQFSRVTRNDNALVNSVESVET